jgi:hypothetical protein
MKTKSTKTKLTTDDEPQVTEMTYIEYPATFLIALEDDGTEAMRAWLQQHAPPEIIDLWRAVDFVRTAQSDAHIGDVRDYAQAFRDIAVAQAQQQSGAG